MFMWPIITLKGLLFVNSCKFENEIPSNCLSYVSFKCSVDHQRFRNFCKKFNSSLFLPFLLRCRPFLPRCTSLMFTLSIKSTSNCPKSLLKLDKVRAALPLSVQIVGLETITLQVGNVFIMHCFSWSNSSRICLDVLNDVLNDVLCTSNSNFSANHEDNENDRDNENHPDNKGNYPANKYMFKVKNRKIIPGVFMVSFEHISHLVLALLILILNIKLFTG